MQNRRVLVTGSAGFIGHHTVLSLLGQGYEVTGLDVINHYYDPTLKYNRLANQGIAAREVQYNRTVTSTIHPNLSFIQLDFTYIDDVMQAVERLVGKPPLAGPDSSVHKPPFAIYNIGNHQPVQLMEMVALLERGLQKKALIEFHPMQPGDVPVTYADVDSLIKAIEYQPSTSLDVGIGKFLGWFKAYQAADPVVL